MVTVYSQKLAWQLFVVFSFLEMAIPRSLTIEDRGMV